MKRWAYAAPEAPVIAMTRSMIVESIKLKTPGLETGSEFELSKIPSSQFMKPGAVLRVVFFRSFRLPCCDGPAPPADCGRRARGSRGGAVLGARWRAGPR